MVLIAIRVTSALFLSTAFILCDVAAVDRHPTKQPAQRFAL
jgi:hypothetical protein